MTNAATHSHNVYMRFFMLGRSIHWQHVIYRMTCADMDALEARAGGRCEICGKAHEKLRIDHDHAIGDHAVRGLVCPKCNSHLAQIDAGKREADAATTAYLNNPWCTEEPEWSVQRVYDPLWDAAKLKAEANGSSLSEEIRRFLERYVKRT